MVQRAGISVSVRGKLGQGQAVKRAPEDPFRLLLLADFSARAGRTSTLGRVRKVDIAHLEQVFEPFGAELELPTPSGDSERFQPRTLEDLHPDALLQKLRCLAEPSELLRAIGGANVSSDALARARAYLTRFGAPPQPNNSAPTTGSAPEQTNDASTLERLLGRAPAVTQPAEANASLLSSLFEDAVRGHKVDAPSAERDMMKRELERVLTSALVRILTTPAFKELEANWRSADRVIRALDTDESLEIALFDVSLAELVSGLSNGGDLEESELHRCLVANSSGWTLLAAGFSFGRDDAELTALAGLGALSARAGGALLADASPALLGCANANELENVKVWSERAPAALYHALRESPLARHIGLVASRVLARARYGRKSEPVEALAFEELDASPSIERVWASGAFAVAELVGRAFRENGWGYSESLELTLDDLPCETVERDGERALVQPVEAVLEQRAAEALLARGLMPWLSRRDQASLRLLQLASIAAPPSALAGIDADA